MGAGWRRFARVCVYMSDADSTGLLEYRDTLGWRNKAARALWGVTWLLLFRPSPVPCFAWRRLLLRGFGATLGPKVRIYPSCRIWAPWNLEVAEDACLAADVNCYSVARITIGARATVSQRAELVAAGHDIQDPHMALKAAPITIGPAAWVCSGAFIGPGITLGTGAVAAARAVVTRNVADWTVVGGNPAVVIKQRDLRA